MIIYESYTQYFMWFLVAALFCVSKGCSFQALSAFARRRQDLERQSVRMRGEAWQLGFLTAPYES